jgi:hypothetical protein
MIAVTEAVENGSIQLEILRYDPKSIVFDRDKWWNNRRLREICRAGKKTRLSLAHGLRWMEENDVEPFLEWRDATTIESEDSRVLVSAGDRVRLSSVASWIPSKPEQFFFTGYDEGYQTICLIPNLRRDPGPVMYLFSRPLESCPSVSLETERKMDAVARRVVREAESFTWEGTMDSLVSVAH